MTNSVVDINKAWRRQGLFLALLLLLLGVLYFSTFESIVAIWLRSETFAHGFIILPISLWLIWRIRGNLFSLEPKPNYLGIPFLVACGFIWLLAKYVDILAIEQLAAVSMIPVTVFALLGWQVTLTMLFPLFFILLAVPLGEELTPALIEFTADFTVVMIKLVGVPVFREGNFLQLPTGNWSVVQACSGVRYLIASATLGLLYSYLNYTSTSKRVIFFLASIVFPIIANGLRAFIIVMLGHLSDMKIATGVDHLIYGWVFFGIVIIFMFYIGSFWWDEAEKETKTCFKFSLGNASSVSLRGKFIFVFTGVALAFWPLKDHHENQVVDLSHLHALSIPAIPGWKQVEEKTWWIPSYSGQDREFSSLFENSDGEKIALYIGYYADQRQGAELGNNVNVLVHENNKEWRVIGKSENTLNFDNEKIIVPMADLKSANKRLLTTYVYYVNGEILTQKYLTKIMQAKVKLFGGANDGAVIFISSEYDLDKQPAYQVIGDFSEIAFPAITKALEGMRLEG